MKSQKENTKTTSIKVSAILVVLLLITNLVLFALGKISVWLFWLIILASAGISYIIKKQSN